MKNIEQQKHRLFICTLAAIAVAVNASQEIRYARAHPTFIEPAGVQPSPLPIRAESAPAYSPPETAIAVSEPVIVSQPLAEQQPAEEINSQTSVEPFVPIEKKFKSKQKQTQEIPYYLQRPTPVANLTEQLVAKQGFSQPTNFIATSAPARKSQVDLTEHRQEKQVAEVEAKTISNLGASQQIAADDQTVQEVFKPVQVRQHNSTSAPQPSSTIEKPKAQPTENRNQNKPNNNRNRQAPVKNSEPAHKHQK